MPLIKSKSKAAFQDNLRAELGAGKPKNVALAIAYDIKRRARAEGGGVFVGPINSTVPGRTDHHPMDVPSGAYVVPAEAVSNLGQNNTNAGMVKLQQMVSGSPDQIRRSFGIGGRIARASGGAMRDDPHMGQPVPINAAGGEFVIPPEVVKTIGGGDLAKGHRMLDAWVLKRRKHHIKTLRGLAPPAQD